VLVIFFLAIGFSITNSIVFLHVFSWLRKLVCGLSDAKFFSLAKERKLGGFRNAFLGRMFHCHACMGFWVGVLLSYRCDGFIVRHVESFGRFDSMIMDGFLLSGFNFVLWLVLIKLGAKEL